jgi:hypothetical protein
MKKLFFSISFFYSVSSFCQIPPNYYHLIRKADSLYIIKEYKNAAATYSMAFNENKGLGFPNDRYNAACSWALAGYSDSAFFNLDRIANAGKYDDLNKLINDSALITLHDSEAWKSVVQKITNNKNNKVQIDDKNKVRADYESIIGTLNNVLVEDQKYRNQIQNTQNTYGYNSKELKELNIKINAVDSENLLIVSNILDRFGWLGISEVGEQGNMALFLVIQHSSIAVQKKYLPMMQAAKKKGNANAEQLALLEDRIAITEGKKQIYGSQIGYNQQTKKYYVLPLLKPENVDLRRKEIGLEPMENYTKKWGIIWKTPHNKNTH